MKMKKIILIIFLYIFCIYTPTFAEEVWTGVYITINDDPWINKVVFDEATINEIYEYEAILMVFLLLFRFFYRIIWFKKRKSFM